MATLDADGEWVSRLRDATPLATQSHRLTDFLGWRVLAPLVACLALAACGGPHHGPLDTIIDGFEGLGDLLSGRDTYECDVDWYCRTAEGGEGWYRAEDSPWCGDDAEEAARGVERFYLSDVVPEAWGCVEARAVATCEYVELTCRVEDL